MKNQRNIPLVGGSNHGNTIQPAPGTDRVEIESRNFENSSVDPKPTESYQRRRFYGEVFGDGFDCFVLDSDDETEQKELARWSLSQPSAEAEEQGRS